MMNARYVSGMPRQEVDDADAGMCRVSCVCDWQVSTDKIRVVTAGRDGMIFLWSGSSARSLSLSRAGAVADCYWQASDDEEI